MEVWVDNNNNGVNIDDIVDNVEWSKKAQHARGWTAAENAQIVSTLSLCQEMVARLCFFGRAGDVESNPGPTTYTQTNTLSQTNKQN